MIKLLQIKRKENSRIKTGPEGQSVEYSDLTVELYADSLAELRNIESINGLDIETQTLMPGSTCYDKYLNIAVLDSTGIWNET